jgi:transcriptional regulator
VHTPKLFQQADIESMQAMMLASPLGALVTSGANGLIANHIPFELAKEPKPYGRLSGHVARANPLWKDVVSSPKATEVLVIFSGADAYVSPSWYPSKKTSERVVPTWDYVVVHVYGQIRVIEDQRWLRSHVERLTNREESGFERPWAVTDAPSEFVDQMLSAIVGIEIDITRMEGKWKVSQNRSGPDRAGVAAGLREQGRPDGGEMADLVDSWEG